MARIISPSAPGLKKAMAFLVAISSVFPCTAAGQGVGPQPVGGQPAWVNAAPIYQVGPNGAVNIDQPVMTQPMQYTVAQPGLQYQQPMMMQQPMMVQQQPQYVPQMAPQVGTPFTQPYGGQPWGAQAIQPQPAWGQPLAATTTADPPFFVHRTSVYGEFLYMRPRDAEVAYGIPIDGPVAPVLGNEVPVGPLGVVDFGYDINFRAGVNVALDKGSSFRGQYTRLHFEEDDAFTVTAPDVIRSLVTHPLGANAATDRLDASASQLWELDVIDLDYRGLLLGCECGTAYAVNYFVGAEYATFDQTFNSAFGAIGTTYVNTEVDFSGVGMRTGLEAERFFPHSGFFDYGNGNTTLLFGDFKASYTQTDEFNALEAFTQWEAGRVVPVLEMELGAGWLGMNRHLRLSAGYRVSAWFNMVKTDEWINSVQTNDYTNMSDAVTFDGLVGRAEWLF